MNFAKIFALIAILALSASPAIPMGESPSGEPQNTMFLSVGQTTTLEIESNTTTGYSWQIKGPINEKVLKVIYWYYKAPNTSKVGAGGVEVWTFKAVGEGKMALTLEYVRPWEKNVAPVKTKEYVVEVKKKK